jgi:predicted deacylase
VSIARQRTGIWLLILLLVTLPAGAQRYDPGDFQQEDGRIVEPPSDLVIEDTSAQQIANTFLTDYPVTCNSYALMPGTFQETTVTRITSRNPGKTVYVVGGVHGNERAAWGAGLLLRNVSIARGTLYVLAPANASGVREGMRYVRDKQDLNRSFPGQSGGNEASQLAFAIFTDIKAAQPDLVLDLHEAISYREGVDFLGNTLIFTRIQGLEDLLLDLTLDTQSGELGSAPFLPSGPGPEGSVNRTVSDLLQIPVITIETFRGFPLELRLKDQLQIVEYVLRYLEMLE